MKNAIAVRRTILERDGLNVAVMTYKEPHGGAWRTCVAVFAEDNPSIWNHADTEAEANERHDKAVRMVKLMGFEEAQS